MNAGVDRLPFDRSALEAVCRGHRVRELCVFGSLVRADFGPASDVDVLVEFETDAAPSVLDVSRLAGALEGVFGRRVDIISGRESIENPYRRRLVLASLERLYAA